MKKILFFLFGFISAIIVAISIFQQPLISSTFEKQVVSLPDVIDLINKERTNYGLNLFTRSEVLDEVAMCRAKYLVDNNLWSHDNFKDCFYQKQIFNNFGENLARNWYNSEDLVEAWMTSNTHRENILRDLRFIGIAEYKNYIVVTFAL